MGVSLYQFKSGFQALLRPVVRVLFRLGVTANGITWLACGVSVVLGVGGYLALRQGAALSPAWWWLWPAWMLLRMALNAMDGMLAREFRQQSDLGAYLNELTDVVSDAALYLPFVLVAPFDSAWVMAVIVLSGLSEMAGLQGQVVSGRRCYDGPMGKSDRAFVFGALGAALAIWGALPNWLAWLMPVVAALVAWSVVNRVKSGLAPKAGAVRDASSTSST